MPSSAVWAGAERVGVVCNLGVFLEERGSWALNTEGILQHSIGGDGVAGEHIVFLFN